MNHPPRDPAQYNYPVGGGLRPVQFVYIIIFIASLSFLGVGIQPPQSDWGSMVRENLAGLPYGSIAPLVPAFAIATLTIAVNMIVDDVSAHAGGKLSRRMI